MSTLTERPLTDITAAGSDEYLVVENISKSYGSVSALTDVSFTMTRGEMLALLGPSGCGKSTLLNVMSGFLGADHGRILVEGRNVSSVPPHRRNMPMVFQSYALFPHMTVRDNVAFGLRQRKVPKAQQREQVDQAMELVQLPDHCDRYPQELSGGQQQRVALARCLVVRPPVLLLDEPLSNLDAQLRADMRDEMNEILRNSGTTSVFVTHDQSEGLAIADRVLLLQEGRVEQEGHPEKVYDCPVSRFAADFIGVANLLPGRLAVDQDGPVVATTVGRVRVGTAGDFVDGDEVVVAIRPDAVRVGIDAAAGSTPEGLRTRGRVNSSSYLGRQRRLRIDCGGQIVTADVPSDQAPPRVGDEVAVSVSTRSCRLVRP